MNVLHAKHILDEIFGEALRVTILDDPRQRHLTLDHPDLDVRGVQLGIPR
jgi:hypothetical protein